MEVVNPNYLQPGDPRLIDQIVYELKSQGIFDQFRKECIADVDTKPAYQNLRQRVEGSVRGFLRKQHWRPDMNKNYVREMLRKNIYESGFLETGVERIVDQVVNPKINTVFLPQVEDVVYRYLGIERPNRNNARNRDSSPLRNYLSNNSLLPTDLEAVSPESEPPESEPVERKPEESGGNGDELDDSKMEEDESPPFEPLDHKLELPHEDSSMDSHLSGFSGLLSHDSNHSAEPAKPASSVDVSNQDSQLSKHSSEGRLSIVTSDENSATKMDVCDDRSRSHDSPAVGFDFAAATKGDGTEEKIAADEKAVVNSKSGKSEHHGKSDDRKKSADKEKSRGSSDRHRSRRDSKERKDGGRKDRDKKEHRSQRRPSRDRKEPGKDDKTKDRDDKPKEKDDKSREKEDKAKDKEEKGRDRDSKSSSKSGRDRSKSSSKHSSGKDKKDSSSGGSSNKDKDKSKNGSNSSSRDGKDGKEAKHKSETDGSKHRSGDKSHGDSKSLKKSSSSSDKHKKDDKRRSHSNDKHGASKSKDRKKDPKKESKDDHFSSKDKKSDRRSTDRDSNDGHSAGKSSSNSSAAHGGGGGGGGNQKTGQNSQESSSSGNGSSGESRTSDAVEAGDVVKTTPVTILTSNIENNEITIASPKTVIGGGGEVMPHFKLIKPKFATNIHEARRLMKIRKHLDKLERQSQREYDTLLLSTKNNHVKNGLVPEAKAPEGEKPPAIADGAFIKERTPPLQNSIISKESWDEVEARLNKEVSCDYRGEEDDEEAERGRQAPPKPVAVAEDDACRHLADVLPGFAERFLDYAAAEIARLDGLIEDFVSGPRAKSASPAPSPGNRPETRRSLKRRFTPDEYTDVRNNNSRQKNNHVAAKVVAGQNDGFPLPLSPAESDKSLDKKSDSELADRPKRTPKGSELLTSGRDKPTPPSLKKSQRYSSDDLYKPRPFVRGSRTRGVKASVD